MAVSMRPRCTSLCELRARGRSLVVKVEMLYCCGWPATVSWRDPSRSRMSNTWLESSATVAEAAVVISGEVGSETSAMKTWRQLAAPVPARTSCT